MAYRAPSALPHSPPRTPEGQRQWFCFLHKWFHSVAGDQPSGLCSIPPSVIPGPSPSGSPEGTSKSAGLKYSSLLPSCPPHHITAAFTTSKLMEHPVMLSAVTRHSIPQAKNCSHPEPTPLPCPLYMVGLSLWLRMLPQAVPLFHPIVTALAGFPHP